MVKGNQKSNAKGKMTTLQSKANQLSSVHFECQSISRISDCPPLSLSISLSVYLSLKHALAYAVPQEPPIHRPKNKPTTQFNPPYSQLVILYSIKFLSVCLQVSENQSQKKKKNETSKHFLKRPQSRTL